MLLATENALARTRPHLRAETHRGLGDSSAGRFFPLRDRHGRPTACEYAPDGNSDAEILEAPRRSARPCLGGSEWRNRLSATCTQPVVSLGLVPSRPCQTPPRLALEDDDGSRPISRTPKRCGFHARGARDHRGPGRSHPGGRVPEGARRHSPGRVCLMTSGRRRDERGFTLVELMLSLMLFTVGILSLSATSAVVVRMMGGARQQTIAATMAQSRLEQLRGLACSSPALTGGCPTARGSTAVWAVATPAP